MELKYANQLSDKELKEIYQLFLDEEFLDEGDDEGVKIVSLDISRDDYEISLYGKIKIPDFDIAHLRVIPDKTIVADNDYYLEDYSVNVYSPREKLTSIYRKYMLENFGTDYAADCSAYVEYTEEEIN